MFPGPRLPNSCQIPSPPLPRPLILLSLPPPDSNSPTCLTVPSAQHTAFVFPRGALPGPSDTEPGTPWRGCQEGLGVYKVMTWELLPLFFLPLIPTLIPASGDSRCTYVPHALSAGERGEGWTRWGERSTRHSSCCLGGRGGCAGEEGEARAELKVAGNTLPQVADVFGFPQKMVKGSLEPHLLYIHTSCLTLSKSLNPQFPQEIYCCVRGG